MRYLWRSITLFSVGGVPVQAHTTFLVFPVGFFVWTGWVVEGWVVEEGWVGIVAALIILLLVYGCLLLHEFAHVLVARHYGARTRRVLLIPFGCVADMESIPREPYEIFMALAGPLTSLVLASLWWCGYKAIGEPDTALVWRMQSIIAMVGVFNIVVAGFNMLPCFPMDGGRMLRSLIALLIGFMSPKRAFNAHITATRIAVHYVAWPVALGIIVLTVVYTHIWPHIIVFGFLMLAGEAEFWVLKESPEFLNEACKLAFLPSSNLESQSKRREPAARRLKGIEMFVEPGELMNVAT